MAIIPSSPFMLSSNTGSAPPVHPQVLVPDCTINILKFPRELRDCIYECIVTEPNTILTTCTKGAQTPQYRSSSIKNRNVHNLNIFRVSKQVFEESRQIFFSRNFFEFNLIEELSGLRYNFVPIEWDYAIKALRHIKVFVFVTKDHLSDRRSAAAERLRHILERATDLRSFELWISQPSTAFRCEPELTSPIYAALEPVRNLQRLKLVVDWGMRDSSLFSQPKILALLRRKMLKRSSGIADNPIWAAYGNWQASMPGYSLTMCHDDSTGRCLLTASERRFFQTKEVHEFRGEDMEDIKRLDI